MDTVKVLQEKDCRFLGVCRKDFPLVLEWSASGVEFFTAACQATAVIEGRGNAYRDANISYLGIFADGQFVKKIPVGRGRKKYCLFEQENNHRVLLRIVKLTEEQYDSLVIDSIEADGEFCCPEGRKRSLFFIGDSITAGYGIEDIDGSRVFSTAEENVTQAYAYRVTGLLDADSQIVCSSGDGIISRWIPEEEDAPNTDRLLPDIFPFSEVRPASALVSYVGTNDASYIRGRKERERRFLTAYSAFLRKVRMTLGNPPVLLLSGAMETSMNSLLPGLAETEGYDYLQFPLQDTLADGFATDTHPSAKTHEKMARLLAEKLQKNLSW